MRRILNFAFCTGLMATSSASAQLITINEPSLNLGFNTLVAAMAADGAALYTGPGEANAIPFSTVSWDASNSKWVVGSLLSEVGDLAFQLQAQNQKFFYMAGNEKNIGFIAGKSRSLNELFVNASKMGYPDQRQSLFDYSDQVAATDGPGDTAQLLNPVGLPIRLQFEHINQTLSPLGPIFQSDESRFGIFRQVTFDQRGIVAGFGDDWLFRIDDDNAANDNSDDGFFYITGDIHPAPEPSQIAALSLLGLGALLIIRRRLVKRST